MNLLILFASLIFSSFTQASDVSLEDFFGSYKVVKIEDCSTSENQELNNIYCKSVGINLGRSEYESADFAALERVNTDNTYTDLLSTLSQSQDGCFTKSGFNSRVKTSVWSYKQLCQDSFESRLHVFTLLPNGLVKYTFENYVDRNGLLENINLVFILKKN